MSVHLDLNCEQLGGKNYMQICVSFSFVFIVAGIVVSVSHELHTNEMNVMVNENSGMTWN